MKNLFVPYEIAKQLKEKGFNEPCFSYFGGGKFSEFRENVNSIFTYSPDVFDEDELKEKDLIVLAPLFQQVVDWFREQHSIEVSVKSWKKEGGEKIDYVFSNKKLGLPSTFKFDYKSEDYYEILNKAIEEALKLI